MHVDFRHLYEAVYIFENSEAQRVKVGMTITNNIAARLADVNDMWLGRTVTCQVCGGRLVNIVGRVPRHVVSGRGCPGGGALPLEKDVALAEIYVGSMKDRLGEVSGSEKGSVTRIVKTLEKRIEYRHYKRPVGVWQFSIGFYTDRAEQVESLSHEILAERLDRAAPFGEVFCCSVTEATDAVETALSQLGLLHSATKRTQWRIPSDSREPIRMSSSSDVRLMSSGGTGDVAGGGSGSRRPVRDAEVTFPNSGSHTTTLDEITALAARQYFEHQGTYRNTHKRGTPEFDAYERGWMQSLRRDNGRLIDRRAKQKAGPYPESKAERGE